MPADELLSQIAQGCHTDHGRASASRGSFQGMFDRWGQKVWKHPDAEVVGQMRHTGDFGLGGKSKFECERILGGVVWSSGCVGKPTGF